MKNNLQIIKELENKFGKFKFGEFYLNEINEVVSLIFSHKGVETKDLELIGELTSLKELDLGWNKITKIEGLNSLVNLEYLYLNNNQITTIQGLDGLTSLKELWLGYANKIDKIEIDQLKIKNSKINVYV